MTASVVYLENALVPSARRVESVEPSSIQSLAPVGWTHPFVAFLDGEPILRADWELVIEDGQALAFVDVNSIPQGGGGGGGSDALRTVAMIAVMIAAPQIGALMGPGAMGLGGAGVFGLSAATWTGIATFAGMALVNAVLPPAKPTTPQAAAALAAPSPTYSLQAQGNTARLDAAIPEHFGRMLAYPDFAAQPYGEFSGNDQYLYQLLCIGRGEYDIEAIRIEDTPISSFEDITLEVIRPYGALNLFPAEVITSAEVSGQEMSDSAAYGPFVASASGTSANYIGIDYVMPRGLYYAADNGDLGSKTVTVVAEAQAVNAVGAASGPWFALGLESITAATTTAQRRSFKYSVPPGRYQVRVHRTDTKDTSSRAGHDVSWSGLRSYLKDIRTFGDVTLLALKMKASNNLSMQASRKVNVICTRKIPAWTPSGWTANTATRSIAWPIAYACKAVGLSDSQIDLPGLLTLDAVWAARGDYFDARFDQFLGWWEAVTKIAQAGRAKPFMQGGVMRVMRDQAVTVPVAMFSMRNIVKGSFNVDYLMPTADTADAVKAAYFDNTRWASASVTASLPDSTCSKPAKVDLFGVTGRDQAHREATYIAATNRYRRKIIHFGAEMEGFIPSFGDLINVQHDMPGWGQGGEVSGWDSEALTLTLTETPTWKSGSIHYIALRKRDGSVDGPHAVTAGASANQVVLLEHPGMTPYTGGDEERTHYAFGWAETYSQQARVLSVKPSGLTRVTIDCVNEDSNVHTADQGITTPVAQTSQLIGPLTLPVVNNLLVTSMFRSRHAFEATWEPSPGASFYIVETSPDGASWTTVANTYTPSYAGVLYNGTRTVIRVAAMGLAKGPWTSALLTTLPIENVSGLSYSTSEAGTLLSWNASVDSDYFDTTIKTGTSWSSGTVLYKGSANKFLWPRPGTGDYTIWAKHNDVSGASSATESSIVVSYTQVAVDNTAVQLTPDGQLIGGGGGTLDLGQLGGTLGHLQFNDDVLIVNMDGADIDVELRFGRTTGGSASMTWNGNLVQVSKPFKPAELGIANISATTPATTFAGQVWVTP